MRATKTDRCPQSSRTRVYQPAFNNHPRPSTESRPYALRIGAVLFVAQLLRANPVGCFSGRDTSHLLRTLLRSLPRPLYPQIEDQGLSNDVVAGDFSASLPL